MGRGIVCGRQIFAHQRPSVKVCTNNNDLPSEKRGTGISIMQNTMVRGGKGMSAEKKFKNKISGKKFKEGNRL